VQSRSPKDAFLADKGQSLARSTTATISKGAQLALLLCGFLGIASVLLVAGGTVASPNAATASNSDHRSGGQVNRKAPPGMAWIPGGAFLMGTNDKESFPNERPAHLVQVQGFWMDEHDVTNTEFSKFVEATPTSRPPAKTFVATPVDQRRVMIQAIRMLPCALSKEVHSFATPPTARVIARARVEERRPTPVRPIQVSDALSLETTRKLPARLEASLLSQNKRLLALTTPKTNEI